MFRFIWILGPTLRRYAHGIEKMEIVFESNPSVEETDFLERKLLDFNSSKIENYSYEDFIIKALDKHNPIIGAIHGQIGGGWLYIVSLWIDENHRGKGVGKKLLSLAEETALERNCVGVYCYTYSFQSQRFYEKLGYKVFGRLEKFCGNHAKIFMQKKLVRQG
jgi:RimJ/RimL family protein N-acetyltransferase